jgi:hypothetical protein
MPVRVFNFEDTAPVAVADLRGLLDHQRRVLSPNNRDWWSNSVGFNDQPLLFLWEQGVASFTNQNHFLRRSSISRRSCISVEIVTNWTVGILWNWLGWRV